MYLLEATEVTRNFGGLTAVDNVSFKVKPGEILGVIGPNGAGKTTLFNLISGFLHLSHGEVVYNGENIKGLKPHVIAKKGLVRTFQQSNIYRLQTVFTNVRLACRLRDHVGFWGTLFNTREYKREEEEKEKRAQEIIDAIQLTANRDHLAGTLSYGQQRSLGIAMALACNPKLILLDEPVCGLGFEEMQAMMERVREIRKRGITVILVEHDMRMVMNVCDRILVLNFGKKVAEGTPAEIKSNREVIDAYLGQQ